MTDAPLFESACHQENMADAERTAACSLSIPMRDGPENTTFSPQAFGERLAVGNPSSWFAPTL